MWISRPAFDDLRDKLVVAQAEARAEVVASKALQVSLDWLRVRVTQLEKERAVLIERFFDVKIPVPENGKIFSLVFLKRIFDHCDSL